MKVCLRINFYFFLSLYKWLEDIDFVANALQFSPETQVSRDGNKNSSSIFNVFFDNYKHLGKKTKKASKSETIQSDYFPFASQLNQSLFDQSNLIWNDTWLGDLLHFDEKDFEMLSIIVQKMAKVAAFLPSDMCHKEHNGTANATTHSSKS